MDENDSLEEKIHCQVPWLFSNYDGKLIGAMTSSRSGNIVSEDKDLEGWRITMSAAPSGHWLFPIVQVMMDLAFPQENVEYVSEETVKDQTLAVEETSEPQTFKEVTFDDSVGLILQDDGHEEEGVCEPPDVTIVTMTTL